MNCFSLSIHALILVILVGFTPVVLAGVTEDLVPATKPLVGEVEVAAHNVRIVRPKGVYADHPTGASFDPMSLILGGGGPTRSFPALLNRLIELSADPGIDTILFDLSAPFSMNMPQLTELRRVLERVSKSGKSTIAWIENGATPHIGIASSCDRTLMADFGTLDMPSLSMTSMHFKDAMDLFGVEASVARAGDFKGAVEPYMLSEMSDHLREHYRAMLTSMNDEVIRWLSEGKGMTTSEVRSIQGDRIFTASDALERGLIDVLVPYGKLSEFLESEHEEGVNWIRPQKKVAPPPSFFEVFGELFGVKPEEKIEEPSIAVLHLDGQIVDGEAASPGSMVSGPIVQEIKKLAADVNIKGVVVRINSPGGSATASEAIRQALMELSAKKPLVYSMGNLAASGGYWITCLGRPIYAETTTITGSIGVFAMKLSFGGLMQRVGIRVTPITLDESAGAMDISRGWTPREIERFESLIGEVYDRFLNIVSESREMPVDAVAKVAGGRVWSGAQAMELGLIDGIGGTETAIAHLLREAGLDETTPIVHRPGEQNPIAALDLFGSGGEDEIRADWQFGALHLLQKAGFDLRGHLRQILNSIENPHPKIMLLSPTDIVVQ